jgi:hypothetical protein
MFASRRINSRGTVCFSDLDRAARLTEIVEAGRPFYEWAKANNKEPKYFSDWSNIIAEYHREKGTVWTEPIAVNSPYGYMGYDLIKPPKEPLNPVQFGTKKSGLVTFSDDDCILSEEDSDDELFYGSDESELSLIDDDSDDELELIEEEDDKYSHLSEQAATFMTGLDNKATVIQCWWRCLRAKHRRAAIIALRKLNVTQIDAKDLPYGTNFLDLPSGMSVLLDEDDIEFSDTPIGEESDNEEEVDMADFIRNYAPESQRSGLLEEKRADDDE